MGEGDSDLYDSEEETEQLEALSTEDREKYEEYKEIHINQLVSYGRTMDISQEIRRHMFNWMPGVPQSYAKRASEAVKKRRVDEEGNVRFALPTRETDIPKKIQETGEETLDEDVLYIKMIPGKPSAKPAIKQEVEEGEEAEGAEEAEEAEKESSDKEEGETIDLDDEQPVNRTEVEAALKALEDGSKLKATGYEKLRKAIPKLSDQTIAAIGADIASETEGKFSVPVQQFLQENEDEMIRFSLAIGLHYLEQHHHHKDKKYKPLKKKDIAKQFNISERKFSEISQGISYSGGQK